MRAASRSIQKQQQFQESSSRQVHNDYGRKTIRNMSIANSASRRMSLKRSALREESQKYASGTSDEEHRALHHQLNQVNEVELASNNHQGHYHSMIPSKFVTKDGKRAARKAAPKYTEMRSSKSHPLKTQLVYS